MEKVILVLGKGASAKKTGSLIKKDMQGYRRFYAMYGESEVLDKDDYLSLVEGEEVEQIKRLGFDIVAVVNRFDSYIPLHGRLVDELGLVGPSGEALRHFRYKSLTDKLMIESGLGDHRPKARVVEIDGVKGVVSEFGLPCVLKPSVGAKSRGVFVLRTEGDLEKAVERIKKHFSDEKISRMLENPEVLVEEYIDGKQIAPVSYVDGEGRLHLVAGVDVLRGPDVGQNHIQNVYRSTPSHMDERMLWRVRDLLQKLMDLSGLRSTFLDPELYIVGDRIVVIEINARLGGFRNTLLERAYGVDLDRAVVELALGNKPDLRFGKVGSCTACEVWDDRSGVIGEFSLPDGFEYVELKQKYQVGDEYVAPPGNDKPLASFYLADDEGRSLERALKMRKDVELEIG